MLDSDGDDAHQWQCNLSYEIQNETGHHMKKKQKQKNNESPILFRMFNESLSIMIMLKINSGTVSYYLNIYFVTGIMVGTKS